MSGQHFSGHLLKVGASVAIQGVRPLKGFGMIVLYMKGRTRTCQWSLQVSAERGFPLYPQGLRQSRVRTHNTLVLRFSYLTLLRYTKPWWARPEHVSVHGPEETMNSSRNTERVKLILLSSFFQGCTFHKTVCGTWRS